MTSNANQTPISLRSYKGKRLVSYLRDGDYAHAGEIESIIQVMKMFPKNKNKKILDVGCGLGGTASFIEKSGWGKVTGIDIESDSIDYARKNYPSIEFHVSDVINVAPQMPGRTFDIICLFNSFYAFHDQEAALHSLFNVSKESGRMVIFDYSDPLTDKTTPLYREGSGPIQPFKPVKIQNIHSLLLATGWNLYEMIDVSSEYVCWYNKLLNKLSDEKEFIISEFGEDAFAKAQNTYSEVRDAILLKKLGGVIVYAEKKI